MPQDSLPLFDLPAVARKIAQKAYTDDATESRITFAASETASVSLRATINSPETSSPLQLSPVCSFKSTREFRPWTFSNQGDLATSDTSPAS
jgi:hypothetical protein